MQDYGALQITELPQLKRANCFEFRSGPISWRCLAYISTISSNLEVACINKQIGYWLINWPIKEPFHYFIQLFSDS